MKTMGVLGPQGTHSEAAATYLNGKLPEPCELVNFADIFDCLQAVEEGKVDAALVPVENSLEGAINITLDTLARSNDMEVARELIWPVHNQLMAKCEPDAIQKIYSHPQPISQCRAFLHANYPHVEIVKVASTARAAEIVAEAPAEAGIAAICTKRAGELLGLKTIASEIQDNDENSTRFFEVRRRGTGEQALPKDKVLIICQISGQKAGELYDLLREFADRGINMTRIESRPARTKLGAYIFFFDLEYTDHAALRESIAAVQQKTIWLKNLGVFPVITAQLDK